MVTVNQGAANSRVILEVGHSMSSGEANMRGANLEPFGVTERAP
jgi:hypothetical protein